MSEALNYDTLNGTIARATKSNGGEAFQPDVTVIGHARVHDGKLLSLRPRTMNLRGEYGTASVIKDFMFPDNTDGGWQVMNDSDLMNMMTDGYGTNMPPLDGGKQHANYQALRELFDLGSQGLGGEIPGLPGHRDVPVAIVVNDLKEAPKDEADALVRLFLLSMRLMEPHSMNMDGVFGKLHNVAWTNLGAVSLDVIDDALYQINATTARTGVQLTVNGIDKFDRMANFVVPTGVRIADATRVRMGAHLAEGTTVMHEGFCNFNAGTLGASMVEGRISAGVVVGDGSDIGGGASTQGTLSGGGEEIISIGKNCLLGANAGTGISLGDDCIIEAGLYLTAGSLVHMPDGSVVKAREISGCSGLLFRRESQEGNVVAIPNGAKWQGLNAELHAN